MLDNKISNYQGRVQSIPLMEVEIKTILENIQDFKYALDTVDTSINQIITRNSRNIEDKAHDIK